MTGPTQCAVLAFAVHCSYADPEGGGDQKWLYVSLGILVWIVSGLPRTDSETPFKWRFAAGPMVARCVC